MPHNKCITSTTNNHEKPMKLVIHGSRRNRNKHTVISSQQATPEFNAHATVSGLRVDLTAENLRTSGNYGVHVHIERSELADLCRVANLTFEDLLTICRGTRETTSEHAKPQARSRFSHDEMCKIMLALTDEDPDYIGAIVHRLITLMSEDP